MLDLKKQVLYALSVLTIDDRLNDDFKVLFPNNTVKQVLDTFNIGLLSIENQLNVTRVLSTVFEINGKLFQYGEVTKDIEIDNIGFTNLIELYDISTEMSSGESYTFLVSSVEHFKLACPKDAVDVKLFLNSLK